jgi:monoamine oxidase
MRRRKGKNSEPRRGLGGMIMVFDSECNRLAQTDKQMSCAHYREQRTWLTGSSRSVLSKTVAGDEAPGLRETAARYGCGKIPARNLNVIPGHFNTSNVVWSSRRHKESSITGAYAFYRPGQWFTIRKILQQRHFHVHFAGENIAEEPGFMEGAVVTEIQAAKSL